MQHPDSAWVQPEYADQSLVELKEEYATYLKGRIRNPASDETIDKYSDTLSSFIRFLGSQNRPITLSSLTKRNVEAWVASQRAAHRSEHGIASRVAALKAFSHKYVFKELQATMFDLLGRVERVEPVESESPELTEEQQERLLDCFNRNTFEDIRNKALIAVYLATGQRFKAILTHHRSSLNPLTGEIQTVTKGNKQQMARLSDRPAKLVRQYLRVRPANAPNDQLWVREDGKPLSYWGGQSIMRRIKTRAGMPDFHCHVLRHNFAKKALRKGAERAVVQDMLGHADDRTSRRYEGEVRRQTAAAQMPKFSPI